MTEVSAKLARRVQLLPTGHGRRSNPANALSVGVASWSPPALQTVQINEAIAALRSETEHRDDMVRLHPADQLLHALMVKLVPSG